MDLQIKGAGQNSDVSMQVDPTFQAARVSLRPLDYGVLAPGAIGGHYAIGTMTGLITAGIASLAQVFQVRWADATRLFILKKLLLQFSTATGFAATTVGAPVEFIVGHGSTANGSGGTALAPTSISNKMRQSMNTTAFAAGGEIRIATTAALTAATGQALEAAAMASCMGADNRTLVSTPPITLFDATGSDHPLILNTGDSMAIRTVSPAATGTWFMSVTMEWVESVGY